MVEWLIGLLFVFVTAFTPHVCAILLTHVFQHDLTVYQESWATQNACFQPSENNCSMGLMSDDCASS